MSKRVGATILLALVTLGLVLGAFVSFQRKRSSFERIDFSFRRHNGVIIVKSVDHQSSAEQAGLRAGDHIWLIGDSPPTEVERLQKTLRRNGDLALGPSCAKAWAIVPRRFADLPNHATRVSR